MSDEEYILDPCLKPALTPEAEENQCIAMAYSLAKKQLADGSASAAVISHFLKMGSSRERLEKERMQMENKLTEAKTQALKEAAEREEKYAEAIRAMQMYSGLSEDDYEDEY